MHAMITSDAIETLRKFNAWRRCDDDTMQPDPREIGHAIDAICDHAERLERDLAESLSDLDFRRGLYKLQSERMDRIERELEQERQDRKQADLDTISALGERNDARAEVDQTKAILADPLAVHLNMMRGTIKWTSANLRHLLGDSQTATEQSHQTKP